MFKNCLLALVFTFASSVGFAEELNFDEPCSAENGAYVVQAEGLRIPFKYLSYASGDRSVRRRVNKMKNASEKLAKAMEQYCEVMNEIDAEIE